LRASICQPTESKRKRVEHPARLRSFPSGASTAQRRDFLGLPGVLSEGIALAYGAHAKGLSPLKPTLLFKTQPHERRAFQATTWRRLKTLPDRAPTFISISTQKCRDRYKMT
jgi:hypothetical protein